MRLLATVVLVAGSVACGGGDDAGERARDDGDADALAAAIAAEAPPGFRPATDADGFPVGAFDLDGFLGTYSTDQESDETLLRDQGFRAGYTRTWLESGGERVATVIGFAFADRGGAERVQRALDREALAAGATRFDVPGLPGATGVLGTEPVDGGAQHIQTVSLVVGRRLFTSAVVAPTPPGDTDLVVALAGRVVLAR